MENLLEAYKEVEFIPSNNQAAMHPGRTAVIKINGRVAGFVGQIHPATAKNTTLQKLMLLVLICK